MRLPGVMSRTAYTAGHLLKHPEKIHFSECAKHAKTLQITQEIKEYLSPERSISFDGFVTYENRRFGVPLAYAEPTARVQRDGNMLYIYSRDLTGLLVSYPGNLGQRGPLL